MIFRFLLCAALLFGVTVLREDITKGVDVYAEMASGHPTPTSVLFVAGQLGLLALCIFWLALPLVNALSERVAQDERGNAARHFQSRMDSALRTRRTRS